MGHYSDFLFARPSFLEGVARVLDIGATLQEYNAHATPQEADRAAIANDWRAIGADLRQAMALVAGEGPRPLPRSAR